MAVHTNKRRRGEESERRPKKKLRIRKQKHYHSSSEDEDEDDQVARDAPARSNVKIRKASPKTSAKLSAKASTKAPKSILKQNTTAQPAALEAPSDDDGGLDGIEINTAMNMAPPSDDDGDDDELEEKGDDRSGVKVGPNDDDEELANGGSASDDEDDDDEPDLDDSDDEDEDLESRATANKAKKRNDPSAFATSISKILDTKLTTSKRADPVLSRSKSAAEANQSIADTKLENQAKAQLRAEKKAAMEKGRVKDLLGLETEEVDTGKVQEEEKRLKKTAQRGVVRLFNAVRAAQVKAEQGMREARAQGVVGMKQREERVNEMSKQGFLDLISSGGGKKSNAMTT